MHVLSNTYVNTSLSVFTVTRFRLVDAVDSWRFIISTNGFAIQLFKRCLSLLTDRQFDCAVDKHIKTSGLFFS